jgi:hypothetical protein
MEAITENINISAERSLGYYELKQNEPWFEEGYSKLLDERKRAKFQWLQDPIQKIGLIWTMYEVKLQIISRIIRGNL